MLIDDIVEIKSDIKYIKMMIDDIKPMKNNYDRIRGGLYVIGVVGSLTLGCISYAAHSVYNTVNAKIDHVQELIKR